MPKPDKYQQLTESEMNERHREKMAKKKSVRARMLAKINKEKGLIIVHTGKGKGKSTAAFGLALRSLGNGFKVGVIQFVKGAWETGEEKILANHPNCQFERMGAGFTWDTQDRQQDILLAKEAWQKACNMLADESLHLIILDELNIVLRYSYLQHETIFATIKNKRPDLHVVITGRNAHADLITLADLVTEFQEIKHPFKSGIKAQKGIEY